MSSENTTHLSLVKLGGKFVLIVIVMTMLTGCIGGFGTDNAQSSSEYIVVVPETNQSVPDNATILDATSEEFANINALQTALKNASSSQEEERVAISSKESKQFDEATSDIERTSEPGVYMEYEGETYRVYLMGLT